MEFGAPVEAGGRVTTVASALSINCVSKALYYVAFHLFFIKILGRPIL